MDNWQTPVIHDCGEEPIAFSMTEKERFEAAIRELALLGEEEYERPFGDVDTDALWNLWLFAKRDAKEQE